jgi:Tfp pilus assembly protein PilN
MEWQVFEFVWKVGLSVGAFIVAFVWKTLMEKVEALQKSNAVLESELNKVKREYVEKAEMERIEHRIDRKFDEMKEYFSMVLGVAKK